MSNEKASAEAKRIVELYKQIEIGSEGYHSWGMTDYQAKQCAIIHVKGILDEFPQGYEGNFEEKRKQHWKTILEEIQKL